MDHMLVRQVSGFRVAAIVFLVVSLITLVKSIFVPGYSTDIINQFNLLLNLITMISFAYIYQFLTAQNYDKLVMFGLAIALAYYVALQTMQAYDIEFLGHTEIGVGRTLDYVFLAPIFFIVAHTLFFRKSIIYYALVVYSAALALDVYEILSFNGIYFTDNWPQLIKDGNAINTAWFGIWLNIYITIGIMCWAIVYLTDRLLDDAVRFEKSTANLSRYFSPTIREKIQEEDIEIQSSTNNSQPVAVLFTDIDGFTSLSENLEPQEIIALLSEYQDKMVQPIFKHLGTVDKFIGDAVMATFGTPVSQGNDAQNAFNCAREMQIVMNQWAKERSEQGLPVVTHRIGIHYGECIVGNIGNQDRKEYTVIGDAVNVASRICELGKNLKSSLIISEEIKVRLLEEVTTRLEKDIKLKGKERPINLHCVDG